MTTLASTSPGETSSEEIRPFRVEFAQEEIDAMKRRVAATRWPTRDRVRRLGRGDLLLHVRIARARQGIQDRHPAALAALLRGVADSPRGGSHVPD